ncbi:MAG: putative motility protein [Rhodospirillales bacterium]|nr:putative motility protein [Rhodospirillales bacterium]MCB9995236.1 putative motility protein [Rhodospirillales bacterium]
MAGVSAGIAAQVALTQQAIALEVLKQSVELQQQAAAALIDAVASVPVSGSLGVNINISA